MVKKVDQAVGELTSQLRTNNLTERVNIIVISDHGKGIMFRYFGGVLYHESFSKPGENLKT